MLKTFRKAFQIEEIRKKIFYTFAPPKTGNTPLGIGDSVAQLVEHNTFNVGVLGSSPSGITKKESETRRNVLNHSGRFFICPAPQNPGRSGKLLNICGNPLSLHGNDTTPP